jgi:hypothetical protein
MSEQAESSAAAAKEISAEAADQGTQLTAAGDATDEAAPAEAKVEPPVAEPPTLREIFAIPEKATDESDDRWQAFQKKLSDEARGIKWTAAMPDLGSKICELLDIKIHDILLTAWKKVEALRKVLEDSKQTPEKVVYLDLAEHSIDYETKPFIDVKIKSASVKKLTLTVLLNLKVKGFVLKVQNGAIRELQTGNCEAKGSIKYGTLSIAEKKLEPIRFPFSIQIPSLIPIPETAAETEPAKTIEKKKTEGEATRAGDSLERIEL